MYQKGSLKAQVKTKILIFIAAYIGARQMDSEGHTISLAW